ncbi:PREDICTED: rho guanine nucleotide exchange factor 28-like [Priapulus caudatus]|uniref:Rho guanine nucleotide exchange factor 28-like n=1 Tax=Priapulus caudatus TaxID=37621 RepID=A0ABM1DYL6_PRICU|nr:PREDICTED: rho guanine nucleotide exchange factor 28-like [Priapulus caudatus]
MMLLFFDGEAGERFKKACATFCANQCLALDQLKYKHRNDKKVSQFLAEAESNPLCRRLQLKDIIPTGMQRLTKYPLLLDNIAKYTMHPSEEHTKIRKAQEACKKILAHVNQSVKDTEYKTRLAEIQRKLDSSAMDRHPMGKDFRNMDLTKHTLMHNGDLVWRLTTHKSITIHAVLLNDLLVLMQKADDKFVLKCRNINIVPGKDESKYTHCPVIRLGEFMFTRNVATDKRAFLIFTSSRTGPQFYELVAHTPAERKRWLQAITDSSEAYKATAYRPPLPTNPPPAMEEDGGKPDMEEMEEMEVPEEEEEEEEVVEEENALNEDDTLTANTIESDDDAEAEDENKDEDDEEEEEEDIKMRYEIIQPPVLVSPTEVSVTHHVVESAERVVTPLAQLQERDYIVRTALDDKNRIIGNLLNLSVEDFPSTANPSQQEEKMDESKNSRELLLAAIQQANNLSSLLNDNMPSLDQQIELEKLRSKEEECGDTTQVDSESGTLQSLSTEKDRLPRRMAAPPCEHLLAIASSINANLTQLLAITIERDQEHEMMVQRVKQLNELLATQTPPGSRPSSLISNSIAVAEMVGVDPNDTLTMPQKLDIADESVPTTQQIRSPDSTTDSDRDFQDALSDVDSATPKAAGTRREPAEPSPVAGGDRPEDENSTSSGHAIIHGKHRDDLTDTDVATSSSAAKTRDVTKPRLSMQTEAKTVANECYSVVANVRKKRLGKTRRSLTPEVGNRSWSQDRPTAAPRPRRASATTGQNANVDQELKEASANVKLAPHTIDGGPSADSAEQIEQESEPADGDLVWQVTTEECCDARKDVEVTVTLPFRGKKGANSGTAEM